MYRPKMTTARTADAAALPRVTDGNGRRVDQDGRLVFDQDGRRAVRLPADGAAEAERLGERLRSAGEQ